MSKKRVAELDTPFSDVQWPVISQPDQDTILELLCSLLAPLGQYRRDHVKPSKGKRSRRRLRQKREAAAKAGMELDPTPEVTRKPAQVTTSAAVPPPPDLAAFVDVGLADITRVLAQSVGSPAPLKDGCSVTPDKNPAAPSSTAPPYTVVFVARTGHPPAFYSHFPQMVAVASRGCSQPVDSTTPAIFLVGFSHNCEERLSACLGIPRVSSIALRAGATQSQGLLNFLCERVPPVRVPWLQESQEGKHRETNIQITEVKMGPKKKKKA